MAHPLRRNSNYEYLCVFWKEFKVLDSLCNKFKNKVYLLIMDCFRNGPLSFFEGSFFSVTKDLTMKNGKLGT